MKVEYLRSGFCAPKTWTKWKREELREKKKRFWSWKKWTPSKSLFKIELLAFIFITFFFFFLFWSGYLCWQCWVLKVAHDFSSPVLVAYKLAVYRTCSFDDCCFMSISDIHSSNYRDYFGENYYKAILPCNING